MLIEKMLADGMSPLTSAHCGFYAIDVETGQSLYRHNAHQLFTPASLVKLVTTAAALEHLGENYRFSTAVDFQGTLSKEGSIQGDLILKGGADPTFNTQGSQKLVDQLLKKKVRSVEGQVKTNVDFLQGSELLQHAEWQDLAGDSAPEVSTLSINENVVNLKIAPSMLGNLAHVALEQDAPYCHLVNQLVTLEQSQPESIWQKDDNPSFQIKRGFCDNYFTITGNISKQQDPLEEKIAVHAPAEYARQIFLKQLHQAGISVKNKLFDTNGLSCQELISLHSIPLSQVLYKMNKESQNLIAELLIRTLGKNGSCALAEGIKVVQRFLPFDTYTYMLHDGAGLSRQNLLSPHQIVSLLQQMYSSSRRDIVLASLPIAGKDGTLQQRFEGTVLEGILHAKTGTLTNVCNLAGYILGKRKIAFCFCMNQHLLTAQACRAYQDQLLLNLYEHFND
jgi:D-alanyl-D-alanine carboxypeptidase/D-alanyl-D-alanine-endopeptidase (penicillin-binding protein 4)